MTSPYTGREFLDSLDDGREVWIYGERVKHIAEHPAFRNCARMLARLYDELHADHASGQACATDTEWGGFTHRYFRAPDHGGRADGRARRDRRVGASHLRLARPLARLQGGLSGDVRGQRRVLCTVSKRMRVAGIDTRRSACRSSITPSSIRRSIGTCRRAPPASAADACVHVTKETDAGILRVRAPRSSRQDRR